MHIPLKLSYRVICEGDCHADTQTHTQTAQEFFPEMQVKIADLPNICDIRCVTLGRPVDPFHSILEGVSMEHQSWDKEVWAPSILQSSYPCTAATPVPVCSGPTCLWRGLGFILDELELSTKYRLVDRLYMAQVFILVLQI